MYQPTITKRPNKQIIYVAKQIIYVTTKTYIFKMVEGIDTLKNKEWIVFLILSLFFLAVALTGLTSFTTSGEILFGAFFLIALIFFFLAIAYRYI